MQEKMLCPQCMQPLAAGAHSCPGCGTVFAGKNPAGALPYGHLLAGRYTVGAVAAVDGEGILYRGVENKGAFPITIKEYLPLTLAAERGADLCLHPKAGSEVLFKTTRMDFADLYRAIQRVGAVAGLEAVLDVVEANNTVYAVMEDPGGLPLEQWLASHGGKVKPEQALEALKPVFEGVAAMHQAGLVHRGICPANIRVLENGRTCLTGYATIGLRTAGSGLHEQLYEGYSAPEQYTSNQFEGRYTDEYGFAAVLYRMLCGQSPVPAGQRMVADSNPAAHSVAREVPRYISDVLEDGLALAPAQRIQTVPQLVRALASPEAAAEMRRELENTTRRQGGAQPATQNARRPGGSRWQSLTLKSMMAGVIVLLVVLILLTLWNMLRSGSNGGSAADPQPPASSTGTAASTIEPVVSVPDFVGRTFAEVQNDHSYIGSYLFHITREYSDTAPEGTIIGQQPAPGTLVPDEGQTIYLVLSQGPQPVEMPRIVGMTQAAAQAELQSRGLTANCFTVVNDGSYVAGCVVSCSYEAGAQLAAGTVVDVYVAAEPQPTPTPEQQPADSMAVLPEMPAFPTGDADPD